MASIGSNDDVVSDRCILVCKPEQSGKTFVMIQEIDKDTKSELGLSGQQVLNIIFCDNSLLLNKQTSKRITAESIEREWNQNAEEYEPFAEFSSRKDKDAEGEYIACQTVEGAYGKITDGVRNIICCTNGKRVVDIGKLIRRINKNTAVFANMSIKIWLDEADKYTGFIDKNFTHILQEHANVSCYYLTATPEDLFKKESRQFSVMPLESTFSEKYHGWDDNIIELHDNDHGGGGGTITFATQVVDDVVKTGVDLEGTKWYIPADRTKKTHAKMSDDLVLRGFVVFIVNGNGITLTIPGHPKPITRGKTDELHLSIRRLINEYSLDRFPIAVSGNVCVGRGISIMAPGKHDDVTGKYLNEFIFDYGILSNVAKKAEASQNAGRIKGNIKGWTGYKKPIVHTTHEFDKVARVCEARSRELAILAFSRDEEVATRITKSEFKCIGTAPLVGSEENFVIDLSDEDLTCVTIGGRVTKKHKEAAIEIIKRDSLENWEKYLDYTYTLWLNAEKECNYKKWGIASRIIPGSMSTTTNVTMKQRNNNMVFMYVNSATKQLIVSPWSGEPKPPTPDMSGGAAEAD
jgi:hypothetical protein